MKQFDDIEDIEQLLKPQCEFHASDNLKDEVIAKAKAEVRPRKVRLIPWLAAACVAGIVGLFLMPPEQTVSDAPVVAKVEKKAHEATEPVADTHVTVADKKQGVKDNANSIKPVKQTTIGHHLSSNTQSVQAMPVEQIEQIDELIMLTERDIPITRPENLIDTPEDLAQIARLEKKAFIDRILEQVEIAKAELLLDTQYEEQF